MKKAVLLFFVLSLTIGMLHAQENTPKGVVTLKGRITDIHFCGDFFSPSDIIELEQAFVNQPYREENIQEVLSKIQIGNYITHLTNEDVMKVMF